MTTRLFRIVGYVGAGQVGAGTALMLIWARFHPEYAYLVPVLLLPLLSFVAVCVWFAFPPPRLPTCHVPGCARDPLPGFRLCGPCRLSYLNGVADAASGKAKPPEALCPACGHFPHDDPPYLCGWHGGTCDDALADPSLWCR